jgi:hypothetical protein
MKVELTDISQGVSVSNPGVNINRLHFKTDTGKSFSVPVSHEALAELLRDLYGDVKEAAAPEEPEEVRDPEPEFDPEATVFGEGGDEDVPREPQVMMEEDEGPQSEEDIPSL